GVAPSQYPVLRSVIVCPETDNAVHTIPAMAITKNMPEVPDKPNRSNTADEIIIVSMVMPETGLRAVVAMALAATDVKKKEKTSVSASPIATAVQDAARWPRSMATPIAPTTTPRKMDIIGMSRSVRSSAAPPLLRNTRKAIPNDPATMRNDLTMPKMPAVAI